MIITLDDISKRIEQKNLLRQKTSEMLYLLESGQALEFINDCRLICLNSDDYIGALYDAYHGHKVVYKPEETILERCIKLSKSQENNPKRHPSDIEKLEIEFLVLSNPNSYSLVDNMTPGNRINVSIKELVTMYIKKEFKVPKYYAKDRAKLEDIWKKIERK